MKAFLAALALAIGLASPAAADTVLYSGSGTYGPVNYKYEVLQRSNNEVWARATAHVNGVDNSGTVKKPIDYSYKTSALNPGNPTVTISGFHTYGPTINAAVKTSRTVDNPFDRGGGNGGGGAKGGNGSVSKN